MVQEYQPDEKIATKNAAVSVFLERELMFCFFKSGAHSGCESCMIRLQWNCNNNWH